jgi:HlyD family secretion protein
VPKPGTVYVLRAGKPGPVQVVTGLSDGTSIEVVSGDLEPGDEVLTGVEVTTRNQAMTPPPGMGGPMMGGPRGMGGGGGRR